MFFQSLRKFGLVITEEENSENSEIPKEKTQRRVSFKEELDIKSYEFEESNLPPPPCNEQDISDSDLIAILEKANLDLIADSKTVSAAELYHSDEEHEEPPAPIVSKSRFSLFGNNKSSSKPAEEKSTLGTKFRNLFGSSDPPPPVYEIQVEPLKKGLVQVSQEEADLLALLEQANAAFISPDDKPQPEEVFQIRVETSGSDESNLKSVNLDIYHSGTFQPDSFVIDTKHELQTEEPERKVRQKDPDIFGVDPFLEDFERIHKKHSFWDSPSKEFIPQEHTSIYKISRGGVETLPPKKFFAARLKKKKRCHQDFLPPNRTF